MKTIGIKLWTCEHLHLVDNGGMTISILPQTMRSHHSLRADISTLLFSCLRFASQKIQKCTIFVTQNHKMTTILFSINFSSSKTWQYWRRNLHSNNQTTFKSAFMYSSPFVCYTLVSRFQWVKRSYLVKFRIFNVSPMMMSKVLAKSAASCAIWWR